MCVGTELLFEESLLCKSSITASDRPDSSVHTIIMPAEKMSKIDNPAFNYSSLHLRAKQSLPSVIQDPVAFSSQPHFQQFEDASSEHISSVLPSLLCYANILENFHRIQ